MRILVVQPTGDKRGHYGIYTAKVCHALAALGHEVTLCTNRLHVSRYLRGEPNFRLIEARGGRLAFDRFDDAIGRAPLYYYWGYFRNSIAVTAAAVGLCRSQPFDVVAIMDAEFMTASLLLRWSRRTLPPVIMFLWASNFSFAAYSGSVFKKAYKVAQREVFRLALHGGIRALAVLGEWHRDTLRAQLKLPAAFPIAVIPDAGEVAVDTPDRLVARRQLGLPEAEPVFLFFGVLRKDKGVEYLLDAVVRLAAASFHVVFAGWPMEYKAEEITEMVRQRGVAGKVTLRLAYVPDEDVPAYFAACDALLLPYTKAYSGGSGPLMKGACTYGRPVIVTRVSEMGRLVEQHALGLVAEPEDGASLAARLQEFLALPDEARAVMAANASALARANSWESLARRFTDLAGTLVAPAASSR
ncbi:MAG TPA: glycosyltransferase family 4 protein [bacterium]|nr:glycosyltransferase family 4 protein [bacterium]